MCLVITLRKIRGNSVRLADQRLTNQLIQNYSFSVNVMKMRTKLVSSQELPDCTCLKS